MGWSRSRNQQPSRRPYSPTAITATNLRQDKELVWVSYEGYVVKVTTKAFAIHPRLDGSIECWVPRSIIGKITYRDGGDALFPKEGERIDAFQVQKWWAKQHRMV